MTKLFALVLWWLIFSFICENINPLEWHVAAKIIFVIIGILITGRDD
jgi:hypothetical protein